MAALSGFFVDRDRKLRPIWRAILYAVFAGFIINQLLGYLIIELLLGSKFALAPGPIALGESINFLAALACTAAFALYEQRTADSYGLRIDRALSGPTWDGFAVGVVMAAGVGLGMAALGGMRVVGLAMTGSVLVTSAIAWLGACVAVGVSEEFLFRSYFLQTLWKSLGFWPASIVIALVFAADHYFEKPGENLWDVITLVSLSLMMCYSVLRTGTLWFAVGFHVSFDFMQLFVIGTPNGDHIPADRLLNATFNGPAWLTGGVLGTEASLLMYPLIALAWAYIWWRYRKNPPYQPR